MVDLRERLRKSLGQAAGKKGTVKARSAAKKRSTRKKKSAARKSPRRAA